MNLAPAALDRAKKRGFTVTESAKLGQTQGVVVRLQPPPGMSAAAARKLLEQQGLSGQLGFNQPYRLFRSANAADKGHPGTEKSPTGQAQGVRPAGPGPCAADRCYGPVMIGWQPKLVTCSRGLAIGMIDTAVDEAHPAFFGRKLKVWHYRPDARLATPQWHGTGVLSVLAGDPRSGTPGLIPDASFSVANVFFNDPQGELASDTFGLLQAIDWLEERKVRVINMSVAGPNDELLLGAIERLSAKGVVFVAAAGNGGPTAAPSYPAAYQMVVAVTAVGRDQRNFAGATRGDYIDVAAPGVQIWTALPGIKEGFLTGTSFATPYATAVLATLYPQAPQKTKNGLLEILTTTDLGPPGRDPIYGRGLLRAPEACGSAPAAPMASANVRATPVRMP